MISVASSVTYTVNIINASNINLKLKFINSNGGCIYIKHNIFIYMFKKPIKLIILKPLLERFR